MHVRISDLSSNSLGEEVVLGMSLEERWESHNMELRTEDTQRMGDGQCKDRKWKIYGAGAINEQLCRNLSV